MSHRAQRGSATVQAVLVTPALLVMLMLIVQFGLAAHARSVAQSAAQLGAAQARRFDGSAAAAREATTRYLHDLGPTIVADPAVSASRTAATATVVVTGSVISVVPFLHLPIRESAAGPVERYVPPSGEFTEQP
jgi:Flp pilus assembly protein TadG